MADSDQRAEKKNNRRLCLIGERFSRLTVEDYAEDYISPKGVRSAAWKCRCDCGEHTVVRTGQLRNGHTKSCGCLSRDNLIARNTTHGHGGRSRDRLYTIWANMLQRCGNPNRPDYIHYGERGIIVCDEWKKFSNFIEWAQNNEYQDGLTIDRIDTNGNYCPSNCRWVSVARQQNNRRNNHYLTYNGETMSMSDWAERIGIPYGTLRSRVYILGWDDERAITTPIRQKEHTPQTPA